MKPLLPQLIAGTTLALAAQTIPCLSQSAASVAPTSHSRPATPAAAGDEADAADRAAEKAQDEALLQQMESSGQYRTKGKTHASQKGDVLSEGGINVLPGVSYHTQNLITRGNPTTRALVVRTSESDAKAQVALEEDLGVMSHILSKSLDEVPGAVFTGNKVMGIDVFFSPGGSAPKSMYLDNYGAVFFLAVNFPLVAPTEKQPEEKPTGDSTWEDARQELYGQRFAGGEAGEGYSQEKVDKLKETLFDALKNGTNIRGIKPDEFVTLWVCGGHNGAVGKVRMVKAGVPAAPAAGNWVFTDTGPRGRRTVLTIRVRKSDIDEYAKGKLSSADFQKRARVTAYTAESAGATGEAMGFGGGGALPAMRR